MKHTREVGLKSYSEWDMSRPTVSPRSRYYQLEPIGIGTPYVESLTSYVARLAKMHHVLPNSLAKRAILPLLNQQVYTSRQQIVDTNYSKIYYPNGLNGACSATGQWVQALESLTLIGGLRYLTMLSWGEAIDPDGLIRMKNAWCPWCYEEWRQNKQVIYEPLIWRLAVIEMCPRHLRPLIVRCPHCQNLQSFETKISFPGHCSRCEGWLGSNETQQFLAKVTTNSTAYKDQLWVIKVTEELLAAAPHLSSAPAKGHVSKALEIMRVSYAQDNASVLAGMLGLKVSTLGAYLQNKHLPSFYILLHMTKIFSITPLQFLTENFLIPQKSSQLVIDPLPISSKEKNGRLSKEAIQIIGLVLREVLSQEPDRVPSIRKLAQQLRCNRGVIKKYWPEEYVEMAGRTSTRWDEKTIAKARQELEKALKSPTPVPLKSVIRLLGSSEKTIRHHFPDLCKAVDSRYCERINYKRYHKRLLEALTESGKPTSVTKLAKELGCSSFLLLRRYPAECQQISERYGEERQKRAKERLLKIQEEVRQVILELHQQNFYPSSNQVGRRLKNPIVFIIPEVWEMWRIELAALGYPTKET